MKKILFLIIGICFVSVYAEENLNNLNFTNVEINSLKEEFPVPKMQAMGNVYKDQEIKSDIYLLPLTSKNILSSYVKNDEEYNKFISLWKSILEKNNFKIIKTEYKNSFLKIEYEGNNGLVIRDFWADGINYNALDKNEINKLKEELLSALQNNNMNVVKVFDVNNEIVRPTFKIYYLTKKEETEEKELQLRQLKKGEDIDFNLLENSVKFVKKDTSFSLIYIGKELGFVSKLAIDEKSADEKLKEYKKFLSTNNKEFINSKLKTISPISVGEYEFKYLLNIYFFQ